MTGDESRETRALRTTEARDALVAARQERQRMESAGMSPQEVGKSLGCGGYWPSIELNIALRLLAEARGKAP